MRSAQAVNILFPNSGLMTGPESGCPWLTRDLLPQRLSHPLTTAAFLHF